MATHDHSHYHPPTDSTLESAPIDDPAQQSLVSALRSSFAILRIIMVVLVVLYLVSGVFRIEPGKQGIIARLGKLVDNPASGTPVFKEGWVWWSLPDPFDEHIELPADPQTLSISTFMFRSREPITPTTDLASLNPMGDTLTPGIDGAMLTGDKNLSHGIWELDYMIDDPAKFVTRAGDSEKAFEPILRRLFESSIIHAVSFRKVEEVAWSGRDELANDVARRLQASLNQLDVGVSVVNVTPKTIVPPQVSPAFDEVTRAEQERQQQIQAALQRAAEILNRVAGAGHKELLSRIEAYGAAQLANADADTTAKLRAAIDDALEQARGEVSVKLRQARAEANTEREQINREYEEFSYWLAQYQRYPEATLLHLWTQMRHDVLDSGGEHTNELFWVPNSNVIEILINRDPELLLEQERQRLQRQLNR